MVKQLNYVWLTAEITEYNNYLRTKYIEYIDSIHSTHYSSYHVCWWSFIVTSYNQKLFTAYQHIDWRLL